MSIDEKNIGETLYWAYSNLAMAHAAYTDKSTKYNPKHFAIRGRLYKGLQTETMNIRSFFDDERLKMILPQECNYCGSTEDLAADHLIPRKKGGLDIGENLAWACKSCNSSKSARDLLEWMNNTGKKPSILIYRRYLKILITYCREHEIMDRMITDNLNLPFDLTQIPQETLPINSLKFWVSDISDKYYRIANWNIERPKNNSIKTQRIISKINDINADIIVLTETSNAIDLSRDYQAVKPDSFDRTPSEQWVTIWSKWKIKKRIATFASKRTACALIDTPFGDLIIYGTIIPYHMAGVRGNRYPQSGYKSWELHMEDIVKQSEDWEKIQSMFNDVPFMVIGDFNQTRGYSNQGYGTKEGRDLLTQELKKNKLNCVTEINFTETKQLSYDIKKERIKKNIDHICASSKWLNSLKKFNVGVWDHFDEKNNYTSDHNGIYLDIEIKV